MSPPSLGGQVTAVDYHHYSMRTYRILADPCARINDKIEKKNWLPESVKKKRKAITFFYCNPKARAGMSSQLNDMIPTRKGKIKAKA